MFVVYRVLRAAQDAISSSLLEVSIDSATGVLFNVTGPLDLGLAEVCVSVCGRWLVADARLCVSEAHMRARRGPAAAGGKGTPTHGSSQTCVRLTRHASLLLLLRGSAMQVMEAGDYISSKVDADAEFIMGAVHDETLGDEVCVTIVATGVSPRTDGAAAARGARQQQVAAAASNGNGGANSRSGSPNPFMVPSAAATAAPAAAAAGNRAEQVEDKPAAGPAGGKAAGGVQVPAFLRNMHRKK